MGKHDEEDRLILSKYFRSIDYIDKVKSPILFIHGKDDQIINFSEAIQLYEKCQNNIKKEINLINGLTHNFYYEELINDIIPYIINFTNKYCPLNDFESIKINIEFDNKFYDLSEELIKELMTRK